jgi:iron complex transport system ATP-binding protein
MANPKNILLHTKGLSIGYQKKMLTVQPLLEDLDLQIARGQMITLIGTNGSGKSTLIKSLIGFIPILGGEVYLKNQKIEKIDAACRAESMGVVLTEPVYESNLSVFDLVAMGRYQQTNWIGKLKDEDIREIEQAIMHVGLNHKTSARLGELSDGERQRALIARVLAQDVDLIILDEPTAHLDLPNRMEILLLLRKLSHTQGKGILLSTHELSLALQVSDNIWLIDKKQQLKQEIPERFILDRELDKAFGNNHITFKPGSASFEIKATSELKASIVGNTEICDCINRMLIRQGFNIVESGIDSDISISVDERTGKIVLSQQGIDKYPDNLEQLNDFLVDIHQEL